jgi:hypothetical protein
MAPSCSSDTCGPEGAPASGMVASGTGVSLSFGAFKGGLNNDCPDASAPAGVVSMTISGTQDGGTNLQDFGLCVTRPDKLADGPLALGPDAATSEIRVIGVSGNANNCTFAIDKTKPITGTASSTGMCGNGADSAGFALVLDGALSLKRTCGATVDTVDVTLRGRVAVETKK